MEKFLNLAVLVLVFSFLSESFAGNATLESPSALQGASQRNKRNSIATGGNSGSASGSNAESLLASCQLTNLLLYQALQQQRQVNANPLLAFAGNLQGLGSNLNLNSLPGLGGGALPGGLNLNVNPLGALGQNLVFPSLTTYTTTSTYVTKLTTTALVTVPLLFGNKPSTTTITRTKTYDLTTSEIKTLTSTVTPTLVVPQIKTTQVLDETVVTPTATVTLHQEKDKDAQEALKDKNNEYVYYEDDVQYQNDVQDEKIILKPKKTLRGAASSPTDHLVSPSKSSKARGTATFGTPSGTGSGESTKFRRKAKPTDSPGTTTTYKKKSQKHQQQYQVEYDYYSPTLNNDRVPETKSKKRNNQQQQYSQQAPVYDEQFYNRQYGEDTASVAADTPVEEDPAAVQYADYGSYYNRRLKRGEQNGDEVEDDDAEYTKLPREYLLEPSYDGDYSGNYQKYEKCPPIPGDAQAVTVTITATETRTITKFLKGQSTSSSAARQTPTYAFAETYAPTSTRGFTPNASRTRGSYNKRNRDSEQSSPSGNYGSQSAAASTSSPTHVTGDPRAQILRRGRTRYTPPQDYEYRG